MRGQPWTICGVHCLVVMVFGSVAGAPAPARAQPPAPADRFRYTVKFVCGRSDGSVVAMGQYYTAINVHNPGQGETIVRKRFSVALPRERAGPVSRTFEAPLRPLESFEIDCPDIVSHLQTQQRFVKGFAVLYGAQPLEVVAVYTASGASGQIETMHMERVAPQR